MVSFATRHPSAALRWGLGLAGVVLWAQSAVWAAQASPDPAADAPQVLDNETCLACHGDASGDQFVDEAAFRASVHGSLDCTSCHADVTSIPHDMPLTAAGWQRVPETCGQCHGDVHESFARGIHGQAVAAGKRGAPVCTDCHGVHTISRVSDAASGVFPSRVPETCGQCHAAERITTRYRLPAYVVETYMDSFHGLAHQLGSVTAANCASCHGAHEILPSSNPHSSIHPSNLPKTCGQCHAGVTAQVASGKIHSGGRPELEHWAVSLVRRFYLVLIMLVLGGMLAHNALDLRWKLLRHYRHVLAQGGAMRMGLNARIQHGLLIIAFVSLAYTGFALKFPTAWWASAFLGHVDWRRAGHRGAAILFVVLAVYHLGFMVGTRRGRGELQALSLRWSDLRQLAARLRFLLGRAATPPPFGRYSYIEKLEYWALVWGSIVMVATGGLMTWQNWTLRVFPKWFFDVLSTVHFYEAVLACLAIVVWHGYFVAMDPDEYPMKWTWLTGRASGADVAHRGDEAGEPPSDDDSPREG